jgi:hypothetical protein
MQKSTAITTTKISIFMEVNRDSTTLAPTHHQQQINNQEIPTFASSSTIIRESSDGDTPVTTLLDSPYSGFQQNSAGHKEFVQKFTNNTFGHACSVCDRLWFEQDLKKPPVGHNQTLQLLLPTFNITTCLLCVTCRRSISSDKIPPLAV